MPLRPSRFTIGLCWFLAFGFAESGRARCAGAPSGKSAASSSHHTHTWYIRGDGGDRRQCTGQADAAYPGRGSKQRCAFKHPYYLFTSDERGDKAWIVAGGDTIVVRGGPYRMGYKGPAAQDAWGSCPGDPFGCSMPPIPSGTSEAPTRLLGEHYGKCDSKTQLFGGYALSAIVNLKGSQHVDLECLELTDHSQCTRTGAGYPKSDGCSSSYPLSDYAQTGIVTDNGTANVLLKNLDIHGLTARGILGPIGGDIVADHVRIGFNGQAGWDFDDGRGTRSAANATVRASYLTVEWSGCNEEYPIAHPVPSYSCFDQDSGGYGDGVGTPDTPLSFTCDHCLFRYNTQDGLDLLHVSGSLIAVTNSDSYGNMGQQWKMGAMRSVVFQNNVTVNNCRRLSAAMPGAPAGYNKYLSLFCRAAGEGITMGVNDDGAYLLQNNSFAGYGATTYDIFCKGTCTRPTVTFENNLHIGYKDPVGGRKAAVAYFPGLSRSPFAVLRHNIYFNMRNCPGAAGESCADPKIANMPLWSGEASLDSIDFHLRSDSPARGAGVPVKGLSMDHDGVKRPDNTPTDIGAFQFHR